MIRLLIVDDSALMRRLLGDVFSGAGDFEVAFARDGLEALGLLDSFRPDVITLDIHMPQMDGLACLDRIMLERPCPVVMVSALTAEGADETLEAMALGAVDFITKPGGAISLKMETLAPALIETVRTAAAARIRRSHRLGERLRLKSGGGVSSRFAAPTPAPPAFTAAPAERAGRAPGQTGDPEGLVLVGTSTGGPPALDALLSRLPATFPWPVLVAQHMPQAFTASLARRLDGLCALKVVEAARPTRLEQGMVYVARGDADMLVARRAGGLFAIAAPANPTFRWHPSVDRLVDSALQHMPAERLVGVLMTGMGSDGAPSMHRLRLAGGHTIAEAESTAVVWGMPGELVKLGGASETAPLDAIAGRLIDAVAGR